MHKSVRILIAMLVSALIALSVFQANAVACSICSGAAGQKSATLRERLGESHAVVRGQLKNARVDADGRGGTTEFHFTTILKSHKAIADLAVVTLPRYYPIVGNTSPDYLIYFDIRDGQPDAIGGQACTNALAEYLVAVSGLDAKDPTKRLAFYFRHLSSPDAAVADDAFHEFVKANDADLMAARAAFDPKQLRGWMADPKTPRDRVGVFALLLGLCGGPDQTPLFVELLKLDLADPSASSLAGVLAGYTLLDTKAGWQSIRDILTDTKQPYARRIAALTAMRYLQANRSMEMRPQLLATYQAMLAGDMADMAIADLRRLAWWDLTADVLPLYQAPGQTRLMKRLVLRYALNCPEEKAVRFVAALRASDPQAVAESEAFLKETEPK